MNRSPEQFHGSEQLSAHHPEKAAKKEVALSSEIEKVCSERRKTLAGIERWLRVKTRERVREKLEKEKKLLMELYQRDRKARAVAQEKVYILNRAYFQQKSLDINIFE